MHVDTPRRGVYLWSGENVNTDSKGRTWLAPAFKIIKATDPATYRRMRQEHWPVCVTDGADDIEWVLDAAGPMTWFPLMRDLPSSFGVTLDPNQPAYLPPMPEAITDHTFLNRPEITAKAEEMGVPVADFLADVLIHEFAHRDTGASEPEAFEAGTRFALKLPAYDKPVADLSEQIAAGYAANPEEY